MASQHEAAGGILVEPVGQHRRPRQAESQAVERGFQIGAALGAAMHRQAGGLVDHQHQPVAMEHAGLDFFRPVKSGDIKGFPGTSMDLL